MASILTAVICICKSEETANTSLGCSVKQGVVPQTYWDYSEVGHTQEAKKEIVSLFKEDVFGTPKPERLMQRILTLASASSDLILDSFAGSGTTGAVAHKMGRRWIMVELNEPSIAA